MRKKKKQKGGGGKRGRPKTSASGKTLSGREEEVLNLLKEGEQYARIGSHLHISTETVRTHAHNIYKKLKVRNRVQAINKFFRKK